MFVSEHGENPLVDLHAYQDIQLRAIEAKESLSRRQKARIVCNYNGKSSRVELTREKFEELTNDLVERCRGLCDMVLIEGNMAWDDIDTVLLVGGSTPDADGARDDCPNQRQRDQPTGGQSG